MLMSICRPILALALTVPVWSSAEGLISPDSYHSRMGDRRACCIGDALTVLVVESTTAESAAGTGANSKTGISANVGDSQHDWQGRLAVQGDTHGAGQTTRRGQVRANVSVRVIEQLAGGLLRVMGEQVVIINDERQQIRVTGLVRPDDISYENTVLSYRLANGQIDILGEGAVSDAQKQSFIFRLFKWLRIL